jgi:hypothetical protein
VWLSRPVQTVGLKTVHVRRLVVAQLSLALPAQESPGFGAQTWFSFPFRPRCEIGRGFNSERFAHAFQSGERGELYHWVPADR